MDSRQPQIEAALADLVRAYGGVADAIDAAFEAEPDMALGEVKDLYETLSRLREQAAALRGILIGRVWEREKLSLTALADRLGVSRQRADQLLKQRDQASGEGTDR